MQSRRAFLGNCFDSGVTKTMWELPARVEFSSTLFQASQGLRLMPICCIHPTTLIQSKIFLSFTFTCLTALKRKFLPRPTCSDQQGPDSKGFKASKPTKAGGAVWLCCSSRLQDVMTWDFKGVLCIQAGVLQPLGKSQCMCLLCLSLIALVNEFLVH